MTIRFLLISVFLFLRVDSLVSVKDSLSLFFQ